MHLKQISWELSAASEFASASEWFQNDKIPKISFSLEKFLSNGRLRLNSLARMRRLGAFSPESSWLRGVDVDKPL